jgi:peptide chain release factor
MEYKWFIQFTAGRGPEECNQACEEIMKLFIKEASKYCFKIQLIDFEEGEYCGFKSVLLGSPNNLSELKNKWEGTIKYICTKNNIRPNHKRKNWFVGCKFYEYKDNEIKLDMKDVRFDIMRASGPGGQHVNRTESCVRAIHIPTGINVICQEQRSQIQNKETAIKILKAKIADYNKTGQLEEQREKWLDQIQLERGNEVLTFKGEL